MEMQNKVDEAVTNLERILSEEVGRIKLQLLRMPFPQEMMKIQCALLKAPEPRPFVLEDVLPSSLTWSVDSGIASPLLIQGFRD